ncbi:MAG: hypothetical protein V1847_03110, partial [Candidatus Diapherotrites archaeon]
FPKFSKEWVQAVDISVFVPSNAPKDSFELGIWLVAPSAGDSETWRKKYGSNYFDGGTFELSRPFFLLHLAVE